MTQASDHMGQRPKLQFWGVVVPIAVLSGLLWFVWQQRSTLVEALTAPSADVALIALLFAAAHFINSSEFWLLYRATGARLGALENWMLFNAGQLTNHLPGQVGTLYRFRYMRAVHGVSYTHNVAVHAANLVITIAGASLAGLIGVLGTGSLGQGGLPLVMLGLFSAMAVGAVVLALVPLPAFAALSGRFGRLWRGFHSGFEQIRAMPRIGLLVVAMETAKYFVTAWRLQVAFSLIGVHQPFWFFMVLAPAVGLASFVAFTPAALGFRELFVTGAAFAMGVDVTSGLLGATIDRAVMLVTFLFLGGIGLIWTYPRLRAAGVQ